MNESVKEKVYTAKWLAQDFINKNKRSSLVSSITILEAALSQYDKTSNLIITETEPERLDITPVLTPVAIPSIMPKPINVLDVDVNWQSKGKYLTPSGKPMGLVVHYTVSGRTDIHARNVCKYFEGTPKSLGYQVACPIMDESGNIYKSKKWSLLSDRNNHAGKSSWAGMTDLSSKFMGIEICNWGLLNSKSRAYVLEGDIRKVLKKDNILNDGDYEAYTQKQELALVNLCIYLKKNCPDFTFDNVVGHDEIAPNRKTDPGGSLSITMPAFRKKLELIYANI